MPSDTAAPPTPSVQPTYTPDSSAAVSPSTSPGEANGAGAYTIAADVSESQKTYYSEQPDENALRVENDAIAGIDGFEVKLSSSVAVGEETGKLDSLLATISETLDYEAEMATKRLVTLLEPVMIVVMGLVVGGVVAAVIVPIYQSYGTIGASSGAI